MYADTRDMLAGHPAVARIHTIDREWKRQGLLLQARREAALLSQLRERRYQLIVHLTEDWRGARLAQLLRPRWSVAPARDNAFWKAAFSHCYASPLATPRHTVESNLDALRRVLEKEGYDVTYISNVDTHVDPDGLLRAKAFLSVGHDEYWTDGMFDNVTRARDAGVSLAFLSGNSISGVVELLPGSDGRPKRVMRRAGRGFQAEQALMGSTSYGVGFADWTSDRPEHWAFEGTNMK